jgi:hypothetical protein
MAAHIVDVSCDPKGDPKGRLIWEINGAAVPPRGVIVFQGDTVQWRSDEGDLTVNFQSDEPFGDRTFRAAAGQLTDPPAVVRANVPSPKPFGCTITLLGETRTILGVEAQPPP